MLAWHVTHSLADRRVIASDAAALRIVARTVIEAAGDDLLAFRGSDNHVHTVLGCDRATAGRYAGRVASALHHRLRLPVPFERTDIRPIAVQGHLRNTFGYVLGNAEHHGAGHDRYFEASNLPDLLGLRSIGAGTRAKVRAMLPRVDRDQLLALLGVEDLAPAFDPTLLHEAACAAAAVGALASNVPEVVRARVAAVHVGTAHLGAGELASLLGITARSVARLHELPATPALIHAVGLQIDLRRRVERVAPDAPFLPVGRAQIRGR